MKWALVLVVAALLPPTLMAQVAFQAPVDRLQLVGGHDRLSGEYSDWNEQSLLYSRQWSRDEIAQATLTRAQRFGLSDTQVEVAYTRPLAPGLVAAAQLGYSPTHNFLPTHSIGGAVQYEFRPAWLVHLRLQQTRYRATSVEQATLMLERYVGDYSASLAWRPVRALGTRATGIELRGNAYYGDDSYVGLIASAGREATQVGAGQITLADVRSVALVGRHRIGPGWSAIYAVNRTRQGSFYTRTGVSAGVQRNF